MKNQVLNMKRSGLLESEVNIILSDRGRVLIDEILQITNWKIKLLVLDDFAEHKDRYLNNGRIEKLVTLTEILETDVTLNVDFRDIENYLKLFHIGDYGYRRINDNIYFSHYQFYIAYSFWHSFFSKNLVDFCIVTDNNHGFSSDYMLEEMAKQRGICTYNVYNHFWGRCAIYSVSNSCILKKNKQEEYNNINIKELANYTRHINRDKGLENPKRSRLVNIVRIGIYRLFGACGLRIFTLLYRGDCYIHYRYSNIYSYVKVWKHFKKLTKYVSSLYRFFNSSKPFFVYFLHFEPEAVITQQAEIIDSQLFYIRLIAQSLPDGYVLYVKEHPDLYKINELSLEYHIPVMDTFYTRYFYDELVKIKQVTLISYKVSATELIKKSKGIFTIAGTVMSEAIMYNKPIIMFAGKRHLYTYDSSIFNPHSSEEIKEAVDEIINGYIPDYSKLQSLLEMHLFANDKQGKIEIINSIINNFHLKVKGTQLQNLH